MKISFEIAINLPDTDLTTEEQQKFAKVVQEKAIAAIDHKVLAYAYDVIDIDRQKHKTRTILHGNK